MTDLIIQNVGESVVGSFRGKKLSAHKTETLNARIEKTRVFLADFELDEPILVARIDDWAMANELYDDIEQCVGETASARAWRVRQRQNLKKELNYGGKSALLCREQQFRIEVLDHGNTWIAKPDLLARAVESPASFGKALTRLTNNYRRDTERLITSYGAHNLSQGDLDRADRLLRTFRMFVGIAAPIAEEADQQTRELKQGMAEAIANGQTSDLPLLDHKPPEE